MKKFFRERVLKAFEDYTRNYDLSNISIALKISHTYRVAEAAERIAKTVVSPQQKIIAEDFAWLLGMLHDIGRFEQVTKYGTFKDALSVDHAELGADILFCEGLFDKFADSEALEVSEDEFKHLKEIAEIAVRLHNKLKIPEDMENEARLYTKILRDADKVDIFRVITEPPYDKRNVDGLYARSEIMQCVYEHRCVPRPASDLHYNELEYLIAQCCMAFELEFEESRNIVVEQGYLRELLNKDNEQINILKVEVMNTWKIKL